MAILRYMLGNLRRRKSYSVVICLLVFLAGLILTVTVSAALNTYSAYQNAFDATRSPQLMYRMDESSYSPKLAQWFEAQPNVESVRVRFDLNATGATLEHDGEVVRNNVSLFLLAYDPQDRMALQGASRPADAPLEPGEIYLPYIYKTANGLKTGDTVEYKSGNNSMAFTVAGFVEEPLFGADLHGIKYLFVSVADLNKLEAPGGGAMVKNAQIRVRLSDYTEAQAHQLVRGFVDEEDVNTGNAFTYATFANGHLTLPKISLAVMIAFVLILCIITVTILRYAILATIEADFTNIGIVKALGFTPGMVQTAITGQYTLLALVSVLISFFASILFTPIVGSVILKSSGLITSGYLSVGAGLVTAALITAIIALFSSLTANRTKAISPVHAIAQGIAPVYFNSRANVRLEKLGFIPFNLRMAIKQVLTKSKRYVLLLVVSALLSYTLVFLLGLVQLFNSEKSINMLGGAISDIRVSAETKQATGKILDQIRRDYPVKWVNYQKTTQLIVDNDKTTIRIMDDFDASNELYTLKGRHPKHENEIAVSELLASRLGKGMGDTVLVKDKNGADHSFLITGLFQTIDDGGTYIRMLESGLLTLDPAFELNTAYVKLQSHDNLDDTIAQMQSRYTGYSEIANERKFTQNKLDTINNVFSAISKLVFVLTIAIIGFITLLVVKITVYSETRELGIYKALGFSAARLRFQLALRFVLVTVIGGLAGIGLEAYAGDKLFSLLMRGVGLSSIRIDFSLINAALPLAAIALIAILSAYLSSRSIKKVSAYLLITE